MQHPSVLLKSIFFCFGIFLGHIQTVQAKPTTRPATQKSIPPTKPTTRLATRKLAFAIGKASNAKLFQKLATRNWFLQNKIVHELQRRCASNKKDIVQGRKKEKHIRIRLLRTLVAFRCGEDVSSEVLDVVKQMPEQVLPIAFGIWLEMGESVVSKVLQEISQTRIPSVFLRLMALWQSPRYLPVLEKYMLQPDEILQSLAFKALQQYSLDLQYPVWKRLIFRVKTLVLRGKIIRSLANNADFRSLKLLFVVFAQEKSSLAFVLRILIRDIIEQQIKRGVTLSSLPKNSNISEWNSWWKQNQDSLQTQWKSSPKELTFQHLKKNQADFIHYSTIHPMFGFGRMNFYFYPQSRKPRDPAVFHKRNFHFALSDAIFQKWLDKLVAKGFFQWNPNNGFTRTLALRAGDLDRKVSFGLFRHFQMEAVERLILDFIRKKKDILMFQDFFKRLDEWDVSKKGKIGVWPFRKTLRLRKKKWLSTQYLQYSAMYGVAKTLEELQQKSPFTTRLVDWEINEQKTFLYYILFGTRELTRKLNNMLSASRRFLQVSLQGTMFFYLSFDKVEGNAFTAKIRKIKPNIASIPRTPSSLQEVFTVCFPPSWIRWINLEYVHKKTHRLWLQAKVKDTHHLKKILFCLANHSEKDHVLQMRVNHSGETDRKEFRLIWQLQWESLEWIVLPTPTKIQDLDSASFDLFTPVYK